jgi:hypothetical protein
MNTIQENRKLKTLEFLKWIKELNPSEMAEVYELIDDHVYSLEQRLKAVKGIRKLFKKFKRNPPDYF